MLVKIVRNGRDGQPNRECGTYQCTAIEVTPVPENCLAAKENLAEPGIKIELMPSGRIFRLPADGDVAYVMNDEGKTIDTHRWPIQRKER